MDKLHRQVSTSIVPPTASTPYQYIDFDLRLNDYRRISILVKNLLTPDNNINDDLNQVSNEYDGSMNDTNDLIDNYGLFNVLKNYYSKIDLNSLAVPNGTLQQQQHTQNQLHIRYKTYDNTSTADWYEYEPWRTIYALICYTYCTTYKDLLNTINNLNYYKLKYKRHLSDFKLIFLVNDNNKFFILSFFKKLGRVASGIDIGQPQPEIIKDVNFEEELEILNELHKIDKNFFYLNLTSTKDETKNDKLNTTENLLKLKDCMNEIISKIYVNILNFIENLNVNDDKQVNFYADYLKTPVERTMDLQQIQQQGQSQLQFKFVNKKKVLGRMNKHRGDLYLLLNSIENAVGHYFKAYGMLKRENDYAWAASSLLGLCVASCYYTFYEAPTTNSLPARLHSNSIDLIGNGDHSGNGNGNVGDSSDDDDSLSITLTTTKPQLSHTISSTSNTSKQSSKALQNFRNAFKRNSSKDLNDQIIDQSQLFQNFQEILTYFTKVDDYSFIEFEICLMMGKYFIEKQMPKSESYHFINYSIYIANLNIKEESRIRRYFEISKLFEKCDMKRVSSFYKWISAGRIFRLIHQTQAPQQTIESVEYKTMNLKRVLNKSIKQILEIFDTSFLIKPSKQLGKLFLDYEQGFPSMKKRILNEIIQLYHYNNCIRDSIKYTRYLIHEMYKHLDEAQLTYFTKFLFSVQAKSFNFQFYEQYYTNLYNFPTLNTVSVIATENNQVMNLPKDDDENEKAKTIYIHRHVPQMLKGKTKTIYKINANTPQSVTFTFSNPLPIQIPIDDFYLLTDYDEIEEINDIKEENFHLKIIDFEQFDIPPHAQDFKFDIKFETNKIGSFKIIGYCINSFNSYSKCLFVDLLKDNEEINSKVLLTMKQGKTDIHSSYDYEVLIQMPVIDEVLFACKIGNNKVEVIKPTVGSSGSPEEFIECYHGETKTISLMLKHDADFDIAELSLFDVKLQMLTYNENEKNIVRLEKLMSNLQKLDDCTTYLNYEIDIIDENACEINLNQNQTVTDDVNSLKSTVIQCSLEIKYANNNAKSLYLYRLFKKTFTVKFSQYVVATDVVIADYSEKSFQVIIELHNLHDKPLVCEYTSDNSIKTLELEPDGYVDVKAIIKKFNFSLLENDYEMLIVNDKKLLSQLLNDFIDFKYKFITNSGSTELINLKFNFETYDLMPIRKFLFQSPLDVFLINNCQTIDDTDNVLYTNIAFKFNFTMNNSDNNEKKYLLFKLCDKIKFCLIGDSFEKKFKSFKKDEVYLEEIRFLNRKTTENLEIIKLKFLFSLNFNETIVFKWSYLFDMKNNKFIYKTKN